MDSMNERSAADELAVAEAQLKAAQERLDAARQRMASEQSQQAAQPADASVDSQGAQSQPQPHAQAQQVSYAAQPAQPASFGSQPQPQQPTQPTAAWQPDAQQAQGQPYATQAGAQQPAQPYAAPTVGEKDHVAAGLLALFLGWLGVHKFYLGYNTSGFIMLGTSILGGILTLSVASWAIWVIAIVEGIFYLSKSQSEFEQMYVINKREWF